MVPPRRKPLRLLSFDYATPGAYFVTLCVLRRECRLGDIVDDDVRLSGSGRIVQNVWGSLPTRFRQVTLDALW